MSFLGGGGGSDSAGGKLTIGVAFETLQTEYWVAGFDAIKAELETHDIKVLEAISDRDSNRQLEQIKTFVTRKVDGIIMVPKDAKTCVPAIMAAHEAGIPIVLFNRVADAGSADFVGVQENMAGMKARTWGAKVK